MPSKISRRGVGDAGCIRSNVKVGQPRGSPREQQSRASWTGGHLTDPYEQKTQQSPGFGVRSDWHPAHLWKYRQESVGIVSTDVNPQWGHLSSDASTVRGCIPCSGGLSDRILHLRCRHSLDAGTKARHRRKRGVLVRPDGRGRSMLLVVRRVGVNSAQRSA